MAHSIHSILADRFWRRPSVTWMLAAVLIGIAVLWMTQSDSNSHMPAAIGGKKRTPATQTSIQSPSPEQMRQQVVGTWEDDYQGSRTLTVRPNGTATMLVEFDGWKARMFTPRLEIETTWTLESGRFNRLTVGGEPADKLEFVKKRVGDHASDKIVKVTRDRMVLLDQDGETRYEWRRVK